MSGWRCVRAAGVRGFFWCPNCRSGLEVRGRLLSFLILVVSLVSLGIFSWYFAGLWAHRLIGFVLCFIAEAMALAFVLVVCLKVVMRIDRKNPDATFVL